VIYLDTHIVVRLCAGQAEKLSAAARRALEKHELLVSAAVCLELELLYEIGRVRFSSAAMVSILERDIGLAVCDLPFRSIVNEAVKEAWTRDPYDRLIVANAKAASAQLITSDERIQKHFSRAVW
jgi:PIN domain nuclease of toxin-antitoxin system